MFETMTRYFWVVAIIVTGINVAILKARSIRHIKANPELSDGYATILRGYLIWMNIPWIVMGIGCTVGGVPTGLHYFRPQDGNPYVLAWFASVFMLWIAGTYWLLFRGGAEQSDSSWSERRDVLYSSLVTSCLRGRIYFVLESILDKHDLQGTEKPFSERRSLWTSLCKTVRSEPFYSERHTRNHPGATLKIASTPWLRSTVVPPQRRGRD